MPFKILKISKFLFSLVLICNLTKAQNVLESNNVGKTNISTNYSVQGVNPVIISLKAKAELPVALIENYLNQDKDVRVESEGDILFSGLIHKTTQKSATLSLISKNAGLISFVDGSKMYSSKGKININITTEGSIVFSSTSFLKTNGGNIRLKAYKVSQNVPATTNSISIQGTLDASSHTKGGMIVIESDHIKLEAQTKILAKGELGGGAILIGGDWQGGSSKEHRVFKNPKAVYQATTVNMTQGASIDASATQKGNGGTVVLWSDLSKPDGFTLAQGSVTAKGGANGGDGGWVESSGSNIDIDKLSVNTQSASSSSGKNGLWLIDPYDYTINASQASAIVSALASSNVEVATTNNVASYGSNNNVASAGGIWINSSIISNSANSLTLKAHTTITQADFVDVNIGGHLTYWADSDNNRTGSIMIGGTTSLSTRGGNITLAGGADNGSGAPAGSAVQIWAYWTVNINSNGGDITMRANATNTLGGAIFNGPTTVNAGTGRIVIDAQSDTGTSLGFQEALTITSASNGGSAISIKGITNNNQYGVVFNNDKSKVVQCTGTGSIDIVGQGNTYGVYLDTTQILAASGAINIKTDTGAGTSAIGVSTRNTVLGQGGGIANSSSAINITSDRLVFSASGGISMASSGTATIQPSGASFSQALDTARLTFGSTLSALTIGKSTNTSNITLGSATTIAGPVTVNGGTISVNGNINTSAGNATGDILLRGTEDIVVASARSVTTNGGDVVLWSNADGQASNGGVFFDQSSSVITNGGHIWIGGGSGTTTWNGLNVGSGYAVSGRNLINFLTRSTFKIDWETGVLFNETILNSAGGNIYIAGQRNTRINSDVGAGVVNYNGTNGTTINSGNGTIEIKGDGALAANVTLGFLTGLHPGETTGELRIQSSNVSQSNAISIQGTNATTDFAGLLVEDDTYILSTAVSGGGAISIVGTSAGNNFGIWTQVGSLNVLSASGPIVVDAGIKGIGLHVNSTLVNTSGQSISNAGHLYLGSRVGSMLTSSTAPIQLLSDRFVTNTGTTINLATTGTVNALSKSAIFSEAVNTAQWNLASNLGGLIIGRSTNTSNVTLGSATTIAGPITAYGANLAINSALTATNNTINLNATSSITQSAALTATNLSLNGTGNFTLNNASNNITTLAGGSNASKLGSLSFTDASGGLTIGNVGANSGLTVTGTILVESLIGDVTLAQNITTDNTTSNAVVVNSGKSSTIGTTTGGNILISGTPSITMGSGGIAKLYSGSEAASTGLTTLVGGLSNTRFAADEGTTTFSPVLAAGNSYAIYRSTVPASPTNVVATAGNAEISIAFTAGADGGGSITNYEYTIDGGTTWIAANPAITLSPLVITGLTNFTAYTVQIRAVNNAGAGIASASVSATPFAPPTIISFAPTSGPIGSTVTLTGTNFNGVTGVTFNGTAATSFTVNSATSITFTIPTGATTGAIALTTAGGTATSTSNYTVAGQIIAEYPFNGVLTPTTGSFGSATYINSASFNGTTEICTDNVNSSTNSLIIPSISTLDLTSFQIDVNLKVITLPVSSGCAYMISSGSRVFSLRVNSSGNLSVSYVLSNGTSVNTQNSTSTITPGTTHAISVQLVSNTIRVKLDGNLVIVHDMQLALNSVVNTSRNIYLGDHPAGSLPLEACFSNFRITNNPTQFTSTTSITSSPSLISSLNACSGSVSAAQSFVVSGSNLNGNITVTPPSLFEVSADGSTYSSSITLTQSSGIVNSTVYVRMTNHTTVSAFTGSTGRILTLTEAGGIYQSTVRLEGTKYANPTITGSTTVNIGSTITLTGSSTASASVPWSSSNTAIATVSSSGVVTGVAGGQTVITYMNTNGCTVTQTIIVPSAVVYANSASGNDITGSGTQASPVKSFHKAYQMVQAGGTINLSGTFNWADAIESGDATTDGYTINKSVTITGEGSDQTIIQAASAANSADRRIFTITSGTVSINNLTMRYGKVSGDGGALLNSSGVVTLNNCRITSNSAGSAGGVKHDAVNTFTANGCTFDSNSAGSGGAFANGGVTNQNKRFNFTNCTFFNNSSTSTVGTGGGGALWVLDGTNFITNCTFSNNKLAVGTGVGASILVRYGSVRIKNSIFVNGKEGANNLGSFESEIDFSGGSATDEGFNIIGKQYANLSSPQTTSHFDSYASTSAVDGIFTKYNSSPAQNCNLSISNTLALNGATNGTYTLETSGVSLNNGSNIANNGVSIPTVDQRGVSRINQTDIGSYESNSIAPVVTVSATSLNAFSTCQGVPSTEQSFTVSGTDLTANITITAPTGYLISTTSGSGFTTSLTLTQNAGNVNSTTIYVRLEGTSTGSPAGNVSVGCLCTSTQDVAVTGTVNAVTVISAHPSTTVQSVCQGTSLTALSVTASGASLTYQWYSNTTASTTGSTLITGATSATYTPVNSTPSALYYYCVVTGTCGTVTSNISALITVSATPVAGTASAASASVCSGVATVLSLTGSTGNIQWQQATTVNGSYTNISGATATSYTTPMLNATTFYRALVSSGVCTADTSNVATVTVSNVPTAPTFTVPTIQSFTTVGSSSWTAPAGVASVEYLVVGGGGGGGNGYDNAGGGGGGAGMVLTGRLAVTEGTVYPITIGDGGDGGANARANNWGFDGQNTIFGSTTALGGGRGLGSRSVAIAGIAQNLNLKAAVGGGGSGGGFGGKGGGGASGNGNNNSVKTGGSGGAGINSSISGTAITYGIGGTAGSSDPTSAGANGTSNRGNGGGGGNGANATSAAGGKGGSGIVILKYSTQSSTISYCQGETALPLQASAVSGNTLQWYTEPTGGTASTTAPTPDTSTPGTTLYYVSQKDSSTGCESPRVTITVTVNAIPVAPTTAATTINYCLGATATALNASTLSGHSIYWFEGTNQLSSVAPIPLTTSVGTTTYSVSQRNMPTGCESPRTIIAVNINAIPTISGVQNMTVGGNTLQLTGSGTPDATTPWASSNPLVATISASGVVTAVGGGNTTITYTNASGCSITAMIRVIDCTQPFDNALSFGVGSTAANADFVEVNSRIFPSASVANFTIETWIRPSASDILTGATGTTWMGVLGYSGSTVRSPSLYITNNGVLHASWTEGSTLFGTPVSATSPTSLAANKWTHVALVKDGTTARLFVDGIQIHSVNCAATINVPDNFYWLGKVDNQFSGSLDEVRFWSTARTQAQIQATMNTELVGNEAGLLTYFDFNQGVAGGSNTAITAVTNKVNNALNGTLINFTRTGTSSNFVGNTTANIDIVGSASVCGNSTSQYTHQIPGGTWSVSNGATATVSSTGLLTTLGSETITLSYAYTTNGCSFTATRVIAINLPAAPTATTTVNLCHGATANALSATHLSGHTLEWYTVETGGTASATAPTPNTTAVGTFTFWVSQRNNITNCEGPRTAITVNVNAIPTISGVQNMIVGGSTLQLTGSGTPSASTPWISSNTAIASISTTGEVTAVAGGSTTITYSALSGCSTTATINVIDCSQQFVFGNALNFDGVNDLVVLDNTGSNTNFTFSGTSRFTLEAWVNRSATTTGEAIIIAKHNGNVGNNYLLSINSNGFPVVYRESNSAFLNNVLTGTNAIPLNEWHHLAVVYDGTNLQLFVDGVLNRTTSTGSVVNNVSSLRVTVGGSYLNSSPTYFFNGSIDDVRIWNIARTSTQIQQNYLSQLQGNEAGLVGYYNFNQGVSGGDNTSIASAVNTVSSASNGTLTNFARTGASSNFVNSIIDITGAATVCANSTAQYSHVITGGTWSVSNGAAASVSASGLLTTSSAENITLTYTYTINGCLKTASRALVILEPSISAQPSAAAQNLCLNGTATALTITANNLAATYQWYRSTTASNTGGTLISGATSSSYTPPTNIAGTTYYYCIVSGTCSPAITSDVSGAVTVSPISVAGTISGATSVCSGTTITLTLAGNTGTIQWQQLIGSTWTDIAGATNTTFTSPVLTQNTSYRAVITSGFCSSVNTAILNVVVNALPSITVQPSTSTQNLCLNATPTAFSIIATGSGLTYQWYRSATASNTGGTLISGATSSSYIPPTNVAGTTYYYCIVSGTCSPAITSDVSGAVTVSPISVAGTITGISTICSGATTTLTLSGSVGAIQWQQLIGSTWTDIAGATNTTFTSPALTQNTSYRAVITSGFCSSVNTTNYNVVVNDSPIISGATTVGTGESVALTATTTAASSNAWVSSNPAIATITNVGVVNGLTIGTTTITYTNSNSCSATQSIAVTAGTTQTPVLTSPATNSPGATILNISYTLPETPLAGSVRLTFTPTAGGTPIVWTMTNTTSVTFSHSVGTDPLVTNPNNVLSGTLLSFATYDLTLSYQDAYGNPVAQVTNTNIQTLAPPSISFSSASYQGTINTSLTTITVLNGGGTSTYSISPTLPNGVSINTTTGVISGTPTVAMASQLYTVTATNAAGTSTATFNLFIDTDLDGDGIGDATDSDIDGDGVPNSLEIQEGTSPTDPNDYKDTDGDGVPDYVELQQNTDPNDPNDAQDTDGDGVPDYVEILQGTNPNNPGDQLIDTDGDGIPDYVEIRQGTDPNDPNDARDTDGDGVPDYVEIRQGTNPTIPGDARDTDGDGVPDYVEAQQGTNPTTPGDARDTDGDGVPDYVEIRQGTNPTTPGDARDTDGDGVPDYVEIRQGTDPNDPNDARDTDGDGVPDYVEIRQGTNPTIPGDARDTDGDGVPDYIEIRQGTNPTTPGDARDTDGDGIPDYVEIRQGTDPNDPNDARDTDGDGVPDYVEIRQGTNPTIPGDARDTDGDGVPDYVEIRQGTNPTTPGDARDTDGDGVPDFVEVQQGTNPTVPGDAKDTDGDGVPDYVEIQQGTNPNTPNVSLNPDTDGDGVTDSQEVIDGTDPNNACDSVPSSITLPLSQLFLEGDCDGDGLTNGEELGLNPMLPTDVDNNGTPDYLEFNNHSQSEDDLEIFNSMTTNGDGLNDVFVIRGIENYPDNNLYIYNRWGVEVYNVEGYGQDDKYFTGISQGRNTFSQSAELPKGTYYFILRYKNKQGVDKQRSGYLYITK